MDEMIHFENQFYIPTTSSLVDDRTQVLKDGNMFAVFDRTGDIQPVGSGKHGLYQEGTRFLSTWGLRIYGRRPLLLSSALKEDNLLFTVDLTNPDIDVEGHHRIPHGTLHLFRSKF